MSNTPKARTHRMELPPTPLQARGVAATWVTGLALVLCTVMILGLLGMIVIGGGKTFWQRPIESLQFQSGEQLLGMEYRRESRPGESDRVLYRVGNRDLGQQPFKWVESDSLDSVSEPADAVLLERQEWGIWLGVPERIYEINKSGDVTDIATGSEAVLEVLGEQLKLASARRKEANALRSGPIADINDRLERLRLSELEAQLRVTGNSRPHHLGWGIWWAVVAALVIAILGAVRIGHPLAKRSLVIMSLLALLILYTERPWAGRPWTQEQFESYKAEVAEERSALTTEFRELSDELVALEQDDARFRIEVRDLATDQFAPISRSQMTEPMKVSQILRVIQANEIGLGGKLKLYIARWWDFLTQDPREANTEGGVFPVIVGTLLVTIMLTIAVVPLGVLAALYMREYAKQGAMISILRVAINNLAGVPSIVYGVFGLGFFCYGIGGVIDGGTDPSLVLRVGQWWVLVLVIAAMLFFVLTLSGRENQNKKGLLVFGLWSGVALLSVIAVFSTPYFEGFFQAKLLDGSPTFGTSGLLWASLTLALLTLPVVIVSAEEAIAAVPASLREGSYGCGASKWQTIQRVVLPGAMPGIMTGAILAMARGAGEVAPLMIVGAVKLAPELPFEDRFPFIFADRSFMHLGFHIFDLGFKSPDSEAARGYVWTTTLLLVTLVVMMNLIAIRIRTKLKARFVSGQF